MRDLRVYLSTAICACHLNLGREGFRQKDVHFYFDLFSNWMESSLGKRNLQNIQIQRYLDQLVKKQILKKNNKLIYTCQDVGLLPVLEEISIIKDDDPLELFFFQYHILQIYHEQLFSMVVDKKIHLPHGLKIELKYILDKKVLVQKQRERITKEIEKLQLRSEETLSMEKTALKLMKEGKGVSTVVGVVEKIYPYQLNNQKKMSELYSKLDPNLQKAELTQHARQRVEMLWNPLVNYYQDYMKRLDGLI